MFRRECPASKSMYTASSSRTVMALRRLPPSLDFWLMQRRFHTLFYLSQPFYPLEHPASPLVPFPPVSTQERAPLKGRYVFLSRGLLVLILIFIVYVLSPVQSGEDIAFHTSIRSVCLQPSPPLSVAAVASAESIRRWRRLAEVLHADASLSSSTPVSVWPSPIQLGISSLFSAHLSHRSENDAEHAVSKFSEHRFLTKNSLEVFPTAQQDPNASAQSAFILIPHLGREPSRIHITSDTASNHTVQTVDDSQPSSSLLAKTGKGSKGTAPLQEPVAGVERLSLQKAHGVPTTLNAYGRQHATVRKGTQKEGVQQDSHLEIQKDPPYAAEASALLGFINESPYHEKTGQQTSPPNPWYARVNNTPESIFGATRPPPRLARTQVHDYASPSPGGPSPPPSAVFESHFRIGASTQSGLKIRTDSNTTLPSAGDSSVPGPQQATSSSREFVRPPGEDEGEIRRKVSSVTVEFKFQPSRSPSPTYTVLPVFVSPLQLSSTGFSQNVPASSLPPPPSSLSQPHPSTPVTSPPAYVPTLYLIPFTMEERSNSPEQAARVSEHISLHPTTFSLEASPLPALSQIHKPDMSESLASGREGKTSESSADFFVSRAATPASLPAAAATAAHQQTKYDVLPLPLPSIFLSGVASSSSGKAKTPKERQSLSPAASAECGCSPDANSQQCRGAVASPELLKPGDSAHIVKQAHAFPTFRTPSERIINFSPSPLPTPGKARSWWTPMFAMARSTPKETNGRTIPQGALGSNGCRSRIAQRSTLDYIAPETPTSLSEDVAEEVNNVFPASRDIQAPPDATVPHVLYPDIRRGTGGLSNSVTQWVHYDTTAKNENFPSEHPAAVFSDSPSYSGAHMELTNDAKMALQHILGLLALITGVEPGPLLNFFIGTRKQAKPEAHNHQVSFSTGAGIPIP